MANFHDGKHIDSDHEDPTSEENARLNLINNHLRPVGWWLLWLVGGDLIDWLGGVGGTMVGIFCVGFFGGACIFTTGM